MRLHWNSDLEPSLPRTAKFQIEIFSCLGEKGHPDCLKRNLKPNFSYQVHCGADRWRPVVLVAEECSWFLGFSTAVWRRFTSQPYPNYFRIWLREKFTSPTHTTHTKRNTIIHTTQTRVQGFTHYKYDILWTFLLAFIGSVFITKILSSSQSSNIET